MPAKIKMYIIAFLTALVGVGAGIAAVFKSQRDTARTERDTAVNANESNEKVIEVKDEIKKVSDDVSSKSNDDVFSELSKYDRNRNKD